MVEGLNRGIVLAVKPRRHPGKALAHGLVNHVMPDGRRIEAAPVKFDRVVALHEDVVNNLMVAAPAQERGALHLVEDVAEDLRAADAVVHVHAHRTHADAAGVVHEVVTDAISAKGVIASGVDGAHIARLQRDVMDLIELD